MKTKCSQVFCKRTNNIHKYLRDLSQEVRYIVSNGFKIFNGCLVELWILLVSFHKKNLRIFWFQKRRCDWIKKVSKSFLNLTRESYNHACKQRKDANRWDSSSIVQYWIAQVSLATGRIALDNLLEVGNPSTYSATIVVFAFFVKGATLDIVSVRLASNQGFCFRFGAAILTRWTSHHVCIIFAFIPSAINHARFAL